MNHIYEHLYSRVVGVQPAGHVQIIYIYIYILQKLHSLGDSV